VFTSSATRCPTSATGQPRPVELEPYHGSLSRRTRTPIAVFETETDVLFSTESAGEGRNLQFCHAMINFDLPWNPMQIEQRSAASTGSDRRTTSPDEHGDPSTLEESILNLLHSKLNLFELVIGELTCPWRINDDFVFEDAVFELTCRAMTRPRGRAD